LPEASFSSISGRFAPPLFDEILSASVVNHTFLYLWPRDK
jgi:hypothetical protein